MIRNKHMNQQHYWRDLHDKHEVDMHYFPSLCRPKLFDLLQQITSKKEKLMVWHSLFIDGVAFHHIW